MTVDHDVPASIEITMSLKQLCQTVRSGQMITFLIFDGEPVQGYLAGLDDNSYFVLEPYGHGRDRFRRKIIRLHGSPSFEIHSSSTYNEEESHDEMEEIIRPFRAWVLKNIFGHRKSKERERVA